MPLDNWFFNYPELVTHRLKNEGREVNKALNVAIQDSSKPRIFIRKRRERKLIKKRCIRTAEGE